MSRISVVPADARLHPLALDPGSRLHHLVEVSTLEQARGEFLMLLGPEDRLVTSGLAALLDALDASGSDAAVASPAAARARTGVALSAVPAVLGGQDCATVLWRRSAWLRLGLGWPDDPARRPGAVTRGLLALDALDVVPEPVTLNQARPGLVHGRSARLRTTDFAVVLTRIADLAEITTTIHDEDLLTAWFVLVVDPALRAALMALPEADTATRDRVVTAVGSLVRAGGERLRGDVRAVHRLQYHLAERGLVDELLDLVRTRRTGALALTQAVRVGGVLLADLPYRGDPRVPDEVLRLDRDITLRSRIDGLRWEGDRLHIEGFAHLGLVDVDAPSADTVSMALVRVSDGHRVPLTVERVHRPDVTRAAREAAYCYDWAGFRTWLDVAALRTGRRWRAGTWRLEATVVADGVERTRLVTAVAPGGPRHPAHHDAGPARVVATSGRGTFAVEVDLAPATLTSASLDPQALHVVCRLRRPARLGAVSVAVRRASGVAVVTVPARVGGLLRRRVTAAIPLDALRVAAADEPFGAAAWGLALTLPGRAKAVPLRVRGDRLLDAQGIAVTATPHGRALLALGPPLPVVEAARWVGDELEVAGRWPRDLEATLLVLGRDDAREHRLPVTADDGRFTARWAPGAVPTMAGTLPLPAGSWALVVRREAPGHEDDRRLPADTAVLATLPARRQVAAKTFTLTEADGGLDLVAGSDLGPDEQGAANQHRLRTREFPALLARGLRDEVLFESYESRAYADNARAVLEELVRRETGLRCRWVVEDGQTALPPGVEGVARFSRAHYEAMARARYVVVPNYRPLEEWLQTPPGQVVVQTWHGAPFKKIGLDNPRWAALTSRDHVALLTRESARWDYLLSPNPTSSPILRGAFAYDGELLETGYPRTDVFFSPAREALAATVRSRLGLPPGKRVVLYAPTMRDDHHYGHNRFRLDLRLDLAAARSALGEDHVLLVRRHAKVVDPVAADGDFARDVSLWPDVNELLLVTDVLVTDYSSLMFDFANTGRPMLFFTYDLADYRDRLRGLYFDPGRMPGPHLSTSPEVVAAIRCADELRAQHDSTYRAFVEEFCVWDDGKAAARFVDRVFAADL